ncbi:MAG: hypothetical protein DCC48_01180 [Acidobacteria bacterium]|nr:MAG: hypothetical protein DCC48_01180 [Acidobacteriota bacterium]
MSKPVIIAALSVGVLVAGCSGVPSEEEFVSNQTSLGLYTEAQAECMYAYLLERDEIGAIEFGAEEDQRKAQENAEPADKKALGDSFDACMDVE